MLLTWLSAVPYGVQYIELGLHYGQSLFLQKQRKSVMQLVIAAMMLFTMLGTSSHALAVDIAYEGRIYDDILYIAWVGYSPDMAEAEIKNSIFPKYIGMVTHSKANGFACLPSRREGYLKERLGSLIDSINSSKTPFTIEQVITLLRDNGYALMLHEQHAKAPAQWLPSFERYLVYPGSLEEYNDFFYKKGEFTLPAFRVQK